MMHQCCQVNESQVMLSRFLLLTRQTKSSIQYSNEVVKIFKANSPKSWLKFEIKQEFWLPFFKSLHSIDYLNIEKYVAS